MSRYSSKSDFYDHIEICGGFEKFKKRNYKIYVGKSTEPLQFQKIEDLIPYYPYIISSSCTGPDGGTINLTSKSWVDIEEERILTRYLESILKYYRSCKRKKIDFDIEEVVKKNAFYANEDVVREIASRIKEKGNKATIEGLHLKMYEYYRNKLQEEINKFSDYEIKPYNKLVRDNIFEIIKENGDTPEGFVLDSSNYKKFLAEKLIEEANEFSKDKNEEEIADVLEVIDCIINAYEFDKNNIERIKREKREKKGSFNKRMYLEQVVSKKIV